MLNLTACGSEVGGDGRLQDFVDAGLIGQSLADELSAPRRAILADGEVTFAEYQRAIFAFISCMEGEGLLIDGFGLGADQTYHCGYGVPHGSPMSVGRSARSTGGAARSTVSPWSRCNPSIVPPLCGGARSEGRMPARGFRAAPWHLPC